MAIYFIIWIYQAFCSFLEFINIKKEQNNTIAIINITIFSIFCGLRGEVDNDYANYVGYWKNAPSLTNSTFISFITKVFLHPVEFGYMLTTSCLKSIGLEYQSIFLFCSILTFVLFYKATKKLTDKPNTALFIFISQFIMMPFMQIRYGVAMSCILYSFACWKDGEKKKSILYFWLGGLFHRLTWGCLLLLPLFKLDIKKFLYLAILSLLIPTSLVEYIFTTATQMAGWNGYMIYIKNQNTLPLYSLIMYFILIIPFLIYYKTKFSNNNTYKVLLKMYLISLIAFFMARNLEILVRISGAFSISFCFILPAYISIFKQNKFNLISFYCILSLYCFLKYYPCLKFFTPYKFNLFLL